MHKPPTIKERVLLVMLHSGKAMTRGQIHAAIGDCSVDTVGLHLRKFGETGLVQSTVSPRDRRLQVHSLTEAGEVAARQAAVSKHYHPDHVSSATAPVRSGLTNVAREAKARYERGETIELIAASISGLEGRASKGAREKFIWGLLRRSGVTMRRPGPKPGERALTEMGGG